MNQSRSRRREPVDLPYYTNSKPSTPTSSRHLMLRKYTRPTLLSLLLILLLILLWHSPPFFAVRVSLCSGISTPASTSLSSDVLLDRFADFASEKRRPPQWKELSTLVMVAGHAIFTGTRWDAQSLRDETNWVLEPFQEGQVSTFLQHIQRGVEITANDSSALLLFSGGQTRDGAGPRSEGMTYWLAADAENWYGQEAVKNRTLSEEYARDSMENLLFSICRFKQVVGRYPHIIKVVSFSFKKVRFVEIHRKAIRFPRHRFQFYGIDPDESEGMYSLSAKERAHAMGPFASDLYGCHTPVLSDKKETRNPFLRFHPYPQGCPELKDLFSHCERSLFSGPLPWDPRVNPKDDDRDR